MVAVTANLPATQLQVPGDGADDVITVPLLAGDATQVEVLEGAVEARHPGKNFRNGAASANVLATDGRWLRRTK